jgi:uncharacterized membrane protein YidH (DUF202 family)
MPDTEVSNPDSAVQRTKLAWERTATAVLAVTTVLLFKTRNPLAPTRDALIVATIAMAIAIYGIARFRGRLTLHTAPDGRRVVRAPNTAAKLIGWGTFGLAVIIVIAMVVGM